MIGDHIIENSYLEEKLGAVVDGPLSGDSHCSAALKKSNVVPKYVCQKKGISVARSGAHAHSVQSNTCQDSLLSVRLKRFQD